MIGMPDSYTNHGIHGINPYGTKEQRTNCPRCPIDKPYQHSGSANSKDLAVNIDKSTWTCHRCGWSGGLSKELKEFNRPVFKAVQTKAVPLADKNMLFFESRGIPKEVVTRNKITKDNVYIPQKSSNEPVICFNYYVGDDIVNIKYRTTEKNFVQAKDASKVFYKLNDIEGQKEVIITEGEMDALSYEVAGYKNAVSVPEGGINPNVKNIVTKMLFVDNCLEYFENVTKIYLALDSDAPGVQMREELARRFGKGRCYIVNFPKDCKDANDVLMKHGKSGLVNSITCAEPYPIAGIHTVYDRYSEIKNIWEHGYPNGAKTGWEQLDNIIKFYDSILAVFTGIPSHGKSNFVDNLMLRLSVKDGWKWGVFSPENGKIEIHVHRLAEILIGKPFLPNYNGQMKLEELDMAIEWINEHIYFIEPDNEDFSLTKILECASYLVSKFGIKGLILDPWNTIIHEYAGKRETDYTGEVLNRLTFFERQHGLFLGIVAHPAKMKKDKSGSRYEVPTLYDISGSANWYNKAELGITVYREFSEDMNETKYTKVFVTKVKHRYMGKTGSVKFKYNPTCQRYDEFEKQTMSGGLINSIKSEPQEIFEEIEYREYTNGELDF